MRLVNAHAIKSDDSLLFYEAGELVEHSSVDERVGIESIHWSVAQTESDTKCNALNVYAVNIFGAQPARVVIVMNREIEIASLTYWCPNRTSAPGLWCSSPQIETGVGNSCSK